MNININDGERYVPSIAGNERDANPIAFNLKYLTVQDQEELEYYEVVQGKGNRVNVKANWKEVFLKGVGSIENLEVNGRKIEDAAGYLAIRGSKKLTDIMRDVAMHLKTASEMDEKN